MAVAGAAVGQVAKLVASMVGGGGLEKAMIKKLEEFGAGALLEQFGGSGLLENFDGQNIFDVFKRLQQQGRKELMPGPVSNLLRPIQQDWTGKGRKGKWRARSAWSRSNWATSRDDWLDNKWKHDWRSQPRDVMGKWVPGRLTYIDANLMYKGKSVGRRTKRRRKLRRAARLRGRKAARSAFRKG